MRKSPGALGEVWLFLALTFLISWGVGAPWVLAPEFMARVAGPFASSPALFVAGWAPSLAALILTLVRDGPGRVGALLMSMIDYRPPWLLFVAFAAIPAIALLLGLAQSDETTVRRVLVHTPLLLFGTAQILTNTGPLGEEAGWRGYALPRLLSRWNPLTSGLVVGLAWTLWHLPAMLLGGIVTSGVKDIGWYALGTIGLSWLMTWLFVRSRGSVLIAGVIPHFVINGLGATGAWASRPLEAAVLCVVGFGLVLAAWPAWRRARNA